MERSRPRSEWASFRSATGSRRSAPPGRASYRQCLEHEYFSGKLNQSRIHCAGSNLPGSPRRNVGGWNLEDRMVERVVELRPKLQSCIFPDASNLGCLEDGNVPILLGGPRIMPGPAFPYAVAPPICGIVGKYITSSALLLGVVELRCRTILILRRPPIRCSTRCSTEPCVAYRSQALSPGHELRSAPGEAVNSTATAIGDIQRNTVLDRGHTRHGPTLCEFFQEEALWARERHVPTVVQDETLWAVK